VPQPIAIGWDGVSWTFCSGWPQTAGFPTPEVARISGLSHCALPCPNIGCIPV
jgi:hypothetical protein